MNKQEELKKLLNYHDNLYYNEDSPELSDAEYDALKNEYVEKYGEYDYVPGKASDSLVKYKHSTNVSSLSKCQVTDEKFLKSELERLWPVIIEPKMDGLTVVTYFDEDVTRGNGKIGEVVTSNMKKVDGIGNRIKTPIRQEVVMLKSEFEKINKEREAEGLPLYKNTRNAAAGMLRRINDVSKIKGLKTFAYNFIRDEEYNDNEAQLLSLKSWNWNTVDYYKPESIEDALEYITTYEEKYRDSLDYDIDGLVIKHNGNKDFGYTNHHPKGALAVKFQAEGDWTYIKNISWQVGRTGKITPVANFEPIDILGSTVNRATLHNYGIIQALGLNTIKYKGKYTPITKVFVIKANDVIPAIIKVEQPKSNEENVYESFVLEPKKCPECGGDIIKENDQLFCINPSCSAKILNRLTHLSQRNAFNIEDLGEETAKKMIDKYKEMMKATLNQIDMTIESGEHDEDLLCAYEEINHKLNHMHPSLIYDFSLKDIKSLPGFAEKSANNLYDNIQNSFNISFDKFLYGAGIPLIGERASKDIAEAYYNNKESEIDAFANDYLLGFEKLKEVKGIGPEMIKSLKENFKSMLIPFGNYSKFNITDVVPKKKAVNQFTFVITGEFEIPRKEIKAIIENAGHKVSGSVSSKTSFLLAAPGEEGTTKYKKAKDIGTTIINSLKELEDVLC